MASRYNGLYYQTSTLRRPTNKNQNRYNTCYYRQTIKVCYVYIIPQIYDSRITHGHSNTRTCVKVQNTRRIYY